MADHVEFKNGRTLDCTIRAIHPDRLEISLGAGTMSIPRSQLKHFEQTDSTVPTAPAKSWEKGNILSAQHAPEAYADLTADFRQLTQRRNAALDAQYMMTMYDRKIESLQARAGVLTEKIDDTDKKLTELRKQIHEIKLPMKAPHDSKGVKAYNELLVAKQNLRAEEDALQIKLAPLLRERTETLEKIPELKTKYRKATPPIPLYRQELKRFLASYPERRPDQETINNDPKIQAFFDKIDRHLEQFKDDFDVEPIKTRQSNGATLVQVMVNDAFPGEFILDTGATQMTINESFARQLGIQLDVLPETEMIVADGSLVGVRAAQLASVAMGSATRKDVPVLIVPDNPNNKYDGLLGMSFLRHFNLGLNGATGELEIVNFR
jgi:clan AA aspartic protease (TIGR02281 family)